MMSIKMALEITRRINIDSGFDKDDKLKIGSEAFDMKKVRG